MTIPIISSKPTPTPTMIAGTTQSAGGVRRSLMSAPSSENGSVPHNYPMPIRNPGGNLSAGVRILWRRHNRRLPDAVRRPDAQLHLATRRAAVPLSARPPLSRAPGDAGPAVARRRTFSNSNPGSKSLESQASVRILIQNVYVDPPPTLCLLRNRPIGGPDKVPAMRAPVDRRSRGRSGRGSCPRHGGHGGCR